jgi:hypothetical protein
MFIPPSHPEYAMSTNRSSIHISSRVAAIPETSVKALTTPISLTAAEKIDAKLSDVLPQFVESRTQLHATVDCASAEISDAMLLIQFPVQHGLSLRKFSGFAGALCGTRFQISCASNANDRPVALPF